MNRRTWHQTPKAGNEFRMPDGRHSDRRGDNDDAYAMRSRPAFQFNLAPPDRDQIRRRSGGRTSFTCRVTRRRRHAESSVARVAVRSNCLLLDSFTFLVCACCHSWPPVTICRQVDKWDYLNQSSVSNLCVQFAWSRRFLRCRSIALLSATAAERVSFSEKFERWRAVKQVFSHLLFTGHISCVRVIATRWYSNAAVCGRCERQNAPFSVHSEFSMPFFRRSHSFVRPRGKPHRTAM